MWLLTWISTLSFMEAGWCMTSLPWQIWSEIMLAYMCGLTMCKEAATLSLNVAPVFTETVPRE